MILPLLVLCCWRRFGQKFPSGALCALLRAEFRIRRRRRGSRGPAKSRSREVARLHSASRA
eukprot:7778864-Alexandrium_andersonii.AAC.1